VVDLSGRPYIVFESPVDKELLLVTKDFPFALVEEFWKSAAFRGKFNLHVDVLRARNGHHAAEAVFKSAARALRAAIAVTGGGVLPTEGSRPARAPRPPSRSSTTASATRRRCGARSSGSARAWTSPRTRRASRRRGGSSCQASARSRPHASVSPPPGSTRRW